MKTSKIIVLVDDSGDELFGGHSVLTEARPVVARDSCPPTLPSSGVHRTVDAASDRSKDDERAA
jgi:hypothetical protein